MAQEKILIVEDDPDVRGMVTDILANEGYSILESSSGEEAFSATRKNLPDLILMDVGLPGADGLEVCRKLKSDQTTSHIPIVMVTGRTTESDIVVGLELGADDYVLKPFSSRVLVARIRTVLRRRTKQAPRSDKTPVRVHGIEIDPGRHEVRVDGKPIDLTPTEFKILYFLASRPGWVFTRSQIVNAIKEQEFAITERSIDVQVVGLRKKLGSASQYLETVRGVGYKVTDEGAQAVSH